MRRCLRCGAEISQCMGSVLARDVLLAQDGAIPWMAVREHCGRCTTALVILSDVCGMPDVVIAYLKSIPARPDFDRSHMLPSADINLNGEPS